MMIRRDGDFTEAEEAKVDSLGEASGGREVVWRMISRSAQELKDDPAIRAAAGRVTREEARSAILAALREVAASDGTSAPEDEMLRWLGSIW